MKLLLVLAGTIFVGLGIIGIFLPVLPTTPFLLIAAGCYARSSQKFYYWLMNNRWFGVYIRNYRQKKGMPLRIKILTVVLLWLTILLSVIFAVQSLVAKVILILIAVGVSIHVFFIKTLKEH
ncbi:MAG: YbaN family protein [Dehalococcoidia bacterium]|nr:MAG: YbaN family protein [Dehalococcoidia bacterium]